MDKTRNNLSDLAQIQKLIYYLFSHIMTLALYRYIYISIDIQIYKYKYLYRYDICVSIEVRKLVKVCAGRL